jgi:hypothetical protein
MPPADQVPTDVQPPAVERDDGFDFDLTEELPPPPPRRRRLPLVTAGLALCAAIGAGVVFGILIQKHWGGSGSSGGGRGASLAAGFGGRTGQTGTQAGGSGRAAGAGAFTRSGTTGQVKTIDGTSLYVTDLQGNTVKVTTGPGVRVRVTSNGTLKKVRPGDYVTVQGTQTASGYKATSITDSGTESPFAGAFGGGAGGAGGSGGTSTGTSTGTQQSGGNGGGAGTTPALPGLGG